VGPSLKRSLPTAALQMLARLPLGQSVNRYSDVSLAAHVERVVQVRGPTAPLGSVLIALGLVLALDRFPAEGVTGRGVTSAS
jgi:hypothetical protein